MERFLIMDKTLSHHTQLLFHWAFIVNCWRNISTVGEDHARCVQPLEDTNLLIRVLFASTFSLVGPLSSSNLPLRSSSRILYFTDGLEQFLLLFFIFFYSFDCIYLFFETIQIWLVSVNLEIMMLLMIQQSALHLSMWNETIIGTCNSKESIDKCDFLITLMLSALDS